MRARLGFLAVLLALLVSFNAAQDAPKRIRVGAEVLQSKLVHRVAPVGADGCVRFGHPSGTLKVGAEVRRDGRHWAVSKVLMSRSARRLMEGWVRVPAETP